MTSVHQTWARQWIEGLDEIDELREDTTEYLGSHQAEIWEKRWGHNISMGIHERA